MTERLDARHDILADDFLETLQQRVEEVGRLRVASVGFKFERCAPQAANQLSAELEHLLKRAQSDFWSPGWAT